MATLRALAHAPWSASKVQTALRCPKLFHYRYVEKLREPEVMPETRIGKAVHKALEQVLEGMLIEIAIDNGAKDLANKDEDDRYRRICENIPAYLDRIDQFRKQQRVSRQLVEYRLAMDSQGMSTAFYSGDAYFRGIVDVAYAYNDGIYALVDHKTGLRQPNANIIDQLEGYAVLAQVYFRRLRKVRLGVHWIISADVDWSPVLSAEEVESELRPKVLDNIEAAALAVADGPRPIQSAWCTRCSYRSVCPQAQVARFEPTDEEPDPGLS